MSQHLEDRQRQEKRKKERKKTFSGVAKRSSGNRQPDLLQRPLRRERLQARQDPDLDLQGNEKLNHFGKNKI